MTANDGPHKEAQSRSEGEIAIPGVSLRDHLRNDEIRTKTNVTEDYHLSLMILRPMSVNGNFTSRNLRILRKRCNHSDENTSDVNLSSTTLIYPVYYARRVAGTAKFPITKLLTCKAVLGSFS